MKPQQLTLPFPAYVPTPEIQEAIAYLESQGLPPFGQYGYSNACWVAAQVRERIILEAAP